MRNAVLNSKLDGTGTRLMMLDRKPIVWEHWQEAQQWDSCTNVGHRLHHKLTADAVNLDSASKMRNSLAFEALNSSMLLLMKVRAITGWGLLKT